MAGSFVVFFQKLRVVPSFVVVVVFFFTFAIRFFFHSATCCGRGAQRGTPSK